MILILFLLLTNFWWWRIVTYSLPLASLIIVTTAFLILLLRGKLSIKFVFIPFIILALWSLLSTKRIPLSFQTESERVQSIERVKGYPLIYSLPIAHWLEERQETLALYTLQKNFFESLDPGLYFFNNHPRERVGYKEFEKFSFVVLPIFILGAVSVWETKKRRSAFLFFVIPILLFTCIGTNTPLGPILLFPFIFAVTNVGVEKLQPKSGVFLVFLAFYILSCIQILSYEIF